MEPLHVIVGGGGIGRALVAAASAQGLRVRAVTRRRAPVPAEVEQRVADVRDRDALTHAVEGAAVVYHAAQPPYRDWSPFPAMTDAIADATRGASAKLVLADNLYMYGPIAGPIAEDHPTNPSSQKGRVRQQMAESLLARHARGDLRVSIGRASDYYGPGGRNSALGEQLFVPALRGKKGRWLGDPDLPHTEHYLDDIARGLLVLGTHDEADGTVWHLPAAPALTGEEFVDLVYRTAGHRTAFTPTSAGSVRLAGIFVPTLRAIHEVMYQWDAPFVIDATRFESAFGPFAITPHERAVAETLRWFAGEERAVA